MIQGETLWAPQAAADRLFLFQEASKSWVCRSPLHYVVLRKLCRKVCENSSRCSVSSMYRPVRPRLVDRKHSIFHSILIMNGDLQSQKVFYASGKKIIQQCQKETN
jgi:hypothetical protein